MGLGEFEDHSIRGPSQTQVPHVLRLEAYRAEARRQGAGQVFVDEEFGH